MIYVTRTRALFTNTGEFIKYVNCPLATRLARIVSAAESEREFKCSNCKTKVRNLAFLTDEQASLAVKEDASTCFFATASARNVVHVEEPQGMHWLVASWKRSKERTEPQRRTLRTARTLDEMNFAVANGFKLVFRRTASGEGVHLQLAVFRHVETGQILMTDDARFRPGSWDGSNAYESVLDYFQYQPPGPALPVAAYVIPPDLPAGEEVFLEDAIEDLICQMPQDTAERMSGWWAVWDGEDLKFLPHQTGGILG